MRNLIITATVFAIFITPTFAANKQKMTTCREWVKRCQHGVGSCAYGDDHPVHYSCAVRGRG